MGTETIIRKTAINVHFQRRETHQVGNGVRWCSADFLKQPNFWFLPTKEYLNLQAMSIQLGGLKNNSKTRCKAFYATIFVSEHQRTPLTGLWVSHLWKWAFIVFFDGFRECLFPSSVFRQQWLQRQAALKTTAFLIMSLFTIIYDCY